MLASQLRWSVAAFAAVVAISLLFAAPQHANACDTGWPVDSHRYFWQQKPHVNWGWFGMGYRAPRPNGVMGRVSPGQTVYRRIQVDAYVTYGWIAVGCGPEASLKMSINGGNWSNGNYSIVGWHGFSYYNSGYITIAIRNTGSTRTSFKIFQAVK